jgi:menaquinol-cytochrome c reductase iron-sulfur subunit
MKTEENTKETRRSFIIKSLSWASGLLGALIAIPVVSSLFEPLISQRGRAWRPVCKVNDIKVGETKLVKFTNARPLPWSGITSQTASWLRRETDNKFAAFAINCTHLGCPVRWLPDAGLFLCPCHGGVYNKDGSYAAGPPPRGLYQYDVRINGDTVEINTGPVPITNFLGQS